MLTGLLSSRLRNKTSAFSIHHEVRTSGRPGGEDTPTVTRGKLRPVGRHCSVVSPSGRIFRLKYAVDLCRLCVGKEIRNFVSSKSTQNSLDALYLEAQRTFTKEKLTSDNKATLFPIRTSPQFSAVVLSINQKPSHSPHLNGRGATFPFQRFPRLVTSCPQG